MRNALLVVLSCPLACAVRAQDPSATFFEADRVIELAVEIAPKEIAKLKEDPRSYVRATLREDGKTTYGRVGVKLKGAAAFQEIEEKPSLTLRFDRYDAAQRLHGLARVHLNNSVQDETYLCEALASAVLREARVPAPRVTHARVRWNDRDLGLYVLKEGFDPIFLARHFEDATGNLYDGGFCTEIDGELEKDAGSGPKDRSDLRALAEACREADPAQRWRRIEERLDVEAFLRLVALEHLIGHWDGYALTANNYRLYFDPRTKKAHFFAHGMDQVFQDPEAPVLDYPNALVAEAVMRNPAWRARYRTILTEVARAMKMKERVVPLARRLEKRIAPVLRKIDPEAAKAHAERVDELVSRLVAREKSLAEQVRRSEPATQSFDSKGHARLTGLEAHVDEGDAALAQQTVESRRFYEIACGSEPCVASYRKRVMLPRGRFAFVARAELEGVVARDEDPQSGAGLRVSGGEAPARLLGTCSGENLRVELEVLEPQRLVELVAELRAKSGRARFEVASLQIMKIE